MIKRYLNVKSSGVEYIGDIPKHWEFIPLKHICYMKGRIGWKGLKQEEFLDDKNLPYLITGQDIQNDKIDWNKCYHISEERYLESPEIMVQKQDLLFTKDGTIGKILLIEHLPGRISLNSHLLLIRPLNFSYHSKFLFFIFKSQYFFSYVNLTKTGTTFYGVSQETMMSFNGLFPPLIEQEQIVKYLEEKTTQIDNLIFLTEKKIEKLKENRTSLINTIVTKGLNPNIELKDTGIECIGMIPSHWSKTKIKYISEVVTGNTPSKNDEDNYIDGKFLWIKPDGLNGFYPTNESKEMISEKGLSETRIVPPLSVFVNGIGNIGRFGYSEFSVSTNQQLHSIVFNDTVSKKFGLYLISNLSDEMKKNSEKVVISIYTKSRLENLVVIVPPFQEQEQIVRYLDNQTQEIDKLISIENKRIYILKEYRQSLISEVVTGKIRVCEEDHSISNSIHDFNLN